MNLPAKRSSRILLACWLTLGAAGLVTAADTTTTQPSQSQPSETPRPSERWQSESRRDNSRENMRNEVSSRRERATFANTYGVIIDHNIFLKDRTVRPDTTQRSSTQRARGVNESLVLRGVAFEDGQYRAYVEDIDNLRMLRLGPGDAVGHGRIAQIDIDSLLYQHDGSEDWIDVGADFTGKQVITIPEDSTESAGGGVATTGPAEAINPNDPNLTIEQKMKLRRLHPELFK